MNLYLNRTKQNRINLYLNTTEQSEQNEQTQEIELLWKTVSFITFATKQNEPSFEQKRKNTTEQNEPPIKLYLSRDRIIVENCLIYNL